MLAHARRLSPLFRAAYAAEVSSADVRRAEIGSDVRALTELLTATTPMTRVSAASALGDLGDPAAVDALIRCLRANDDLLRNAAIIALRNIGDKSVLPALMEVATADEASGVRTTAIDALATLGDPRGVQMLAQLAVDPSQLVGSASRTFSPWVNSRYRPSIRARRIRAWALKRLRELHVVEAVPHLEASRPPLSPLLRLRYMWTLRVLRNLASGVIRGR